MTKQIPLSKGLFALVDDADYEWLSQWKWYASTHKCGAYAMRHAPNPAKCPRQISIFMHRLILNAPNGYEVDHINHNGLDNRRANLRVVTVAQNQCNRKHEYGSSRFKGVHWDKVRGQWRAYIWYNKKGIKLGHYPDERAAARAYNEAAKRLFGAFACLNAVD